MSPRRRDFRERLEDEPAAVKPAMGERQGFRDDSLAANVEEIDVDRARTVGEGRPAPSAPLDTLDFGQQGGRRELRPDLDDGIEEIALPRVSLGGRFVDR